jgi:hypothetical protein
MKLVLLFTVIVLVIWGVLDNSDTMAQFSLALFFAGLFLLAQAED